MYVLASILLCQCLRQIKWISTKHSLSRIRICLRVFTDVVNIILLPIRMAQIIIHFTRQLNKKLMVFVLFITVFDCPDEGGDVIKKVRHPLESLTPHKSPALSCSYRRFFVDTLYLLGPDVVSMFRPLSGDRSESLQSVALSRVSLKTVMPTWRQTCLVRAQRRCQLLNVETPP